MAAPATQVEWCGYRCLRSCLQHYSGDPGEAGHRSALPLHCNWCIAITAAVALFAGLSQARSCDRQHLPADASCHHSSMCVVQPGTQSKNCSICSRVRCCFLQTRSSPPSTSPRPSSGASAESLRIYYYNTTTSILARVLSRRILNSLCLPLKQLLGLWK